MSVKIPLHIQDLEPYRSGKPIADLAREKNLTKIVKLASNENPLGASPKAMAAIETAMQELHRYPDAKAFDLVHALAHDCGRKPDEIICGNGSDSLLAYLLYAFTHEGDEVLTSAGSFIGMYVNAKKLGRKLNLVALNNYAYDLDAIRRAVTPAVKVIYLANPNNPTGSMFSRAAFEAFMSKIPKEILVILDEAYSLYAEDHAEYPDGLDYRFDNLLVLRTFSKAHGLAGLRVGFAVGPEKLIAELYKVKLPFEPNLLAQTAAQAALADGEFLHRTKAMNQLSLQVFTQVFETLGIRYVPSAANFLMMVFADESQAVRFYEECLSEGLILRPLKSFGLPEGVRINSGTEQETAFAAAVIEKVWNNLTSSKSEKRNVAFVPGVV